MTERVAVWTGEGQSLSELAAALIALADNPHEVVWEHRAGHLTVPEYVAARYAEGMTAADDGAAEVTEPADQPGTDPVPSAKRKPGRPRKTVPAVTDEVN